MSKVYNWQLGREMDYPYEEKHPDWQFAFVFNINRCIACQTCTMACKSTWTFSRGQENMWWNNVETKPYGGYPAHWDQKILGMLAKEDPKGQRWNTSGKRGNQNPYGKFEGKTIFETNRTGGAESNRVLGYLPTDEEWKNPNTHEEVATGMAQPGKEWGGSAMLPEHKVWFFYLQRICNHCTYAACLAACPRKAIYKRPEDGIVLIDQNRCRGYRKCVEACPYKKSMYRATTGASEKCIGCFPRIEGQDPDLLPDGVVPLETRCMSACVGKIRMQGLVKKNPDGTWAEAADNPLHFMIRDRKIALPLYPQFGTEPNGYYIPPRWVPRPYLRQMFGPGVDSALEQYCNPDRELLSVFQLFRASQQIIFKYKIEKGPKVAEREVMMPDGKTQTQEIFNDTSIGYNKAGKEIIRVTVEEPTFERSKEHLNSI